MGAKVIQLKTMVGRNDPCPCGSGKKYKKCCLPKHEEEEQLRQRLESPEIVSDRYFSVKEYISEAGFPLTNLDFFLLEILNITGSILYKFKKLSQVQTKEVLKKIMSEARLFFINCRKCNVGCLKEPYKRISFESLINKGLKLDEFPEVLQRPLSVNFFYFEFLNVIISIISDEIKYLLPEETADEIASMVHASIFDYVADNCWEQCDNKCTKEHDRNAYCSFCSFSGNKLPCPKQGDISYEEVHATEEDMMH